MEERFALSEKEIEEVFIIWAKKCKEEPDNYEGLDDSVSIEEYGKNCAQEFTKIIRQL
jgi:hypothetical protein